MQNRQAAGRAKFGSSRVAWIEKQHAAKRFLVLLVRVTEDNDVRPLAHDVTGDLLIKRPRIDDVVNKKFSRGQLDDFSFLERHR